MARLSDSNKILAHDKNAKDLMEKVKNRPEFKQNKIVISWIPKYGARYVFGVSLLLGSDQFSIHASIVKGNTIPPLLGKKGVFDGRYSLTIDSKRIVTVLNRN